MLKGQKLKTIGGVEVALLPMRYLRVTQTIDEDGTTHDGTLNIDLAGRDSGRDDMYAPVSWSVVRNSNTPNHEVIYWSDNKVLWANGTIDYISVRVLHDDVVIDLPVGRNFDQGDVCYQEGNTGDSQGNHIHLCVARGHTTKIIKHASGYRDLDGSVNPSDVFYINDTIVIKDGGLKWGIYVPPIVPPPIIPIKVGDKVFIKTTATTYLSGVKIPQSRKKGGVFAKNPYTIKQDGDTDRYKKNNGYWLLKEINSWVKKTEVERK